MLGTIELDGEACIGTDEIDPHAPKPGNGQLGTEMKAPGRSAWSRRSLQKGLPPAVGASDAQRFTNKCPRSIRWRGQADSPSGRCAGARSGGHGRPRPHLLGQSPGTTLLARILWSRARSSNRCYWGMEIALSKIEKIGVGAQFSALNAAVDSGDRASTGKIVRDWQLTRISREEHGGLGELCDDGVTSGRAGVPSPAGLKYRQWKPPRGARRMRVVSSWG
jgi:hypothetical protein